MRVERLKLKNTTDINIHSINAYLKELSEEESDSLFKNMEDIFDFYGISERTFKDILYKEQVPGSFPGNKYSDLLGLTNAMLFQLKYKKRNYKTSETKTGS